LLNHGENHGDFRDVRLGFWQWNENRFGGVEFLGGHVADWTLSFGKVDVLRMELEIGLRNLKGAGSLYWRRGGFRIRTRLFDRRSSRVGVDGGRSLGLRVLFRIFRLLDGGLD
jgi:hypothetical protein